ncbi:MAG: glutathione synthase [Halofilum sp. (in: g-proteobacteria)]|nr:glutathione synthase [Halofilum sp. (in: g-proteobacteria)]
MSRRLGFVMDPLAGITPYKDSTLAMMLAAQARGWTLYEIHVPDLALVDGRISARMRRVEVHDDDHHWHDVLDVVEGPLTRLDTVLMRKDPPFDMEYVYATYLLEQAEAAGVPVINRPRGLRDANEKLFTAWFPQCCPPTAVSARHEVLRAFIAEQEDTIVKPLDGMGGTGVFRLHARDPNINSVLETLTARYRRPIMAQRYLPAIREGDKRILLVDGEPLEYCLARLAGEGETRANLAAGGAYRAQPLSDADRWICDQVAPALREHGLTFVGLDVIGDRLTEVNVTSPTCIREIARGSGADAAERLLDAIERRLGTV